MSSADKDDPYRRKGPSPNMFLQQKIPMRQLVFTPKLVISTLLGAGILLLVIGGIVVNLNSGVKSFEFTYVDEDSGAECPQDLSQVAQGAKCYDVCPHRGCAINFKIEEDIEGPVYFYYKLTNFYQNHRRIVKSRSDPQLRGDFGTDGEKPNSVTGTCEAAERYSIGTDSDGSEKYVYYYPCGMVARSVFNDTFTLMKNTSGVMSTVGWTTEGVSSWSGKDKTNSKDEAWLRQNCYSLDNNLAVSGFSPSLATFTGTGNYETSKFHCWRNVSDESFIVWMKPAANPNFWKLHRILDGDLKAGDYVITVDLRFPVTAFQGSKGFVLTNASPMGGEKSTLGVLYITVGAISAVAGLVLLALALIKPGPLVKPAVEYPAIEIDSTKHKAAPDSSKSKSVIGSAIASCIKPSSGVARGGDEGRTVLCPGNPQHAAENLFSSNFVSTTKYTAVTFLPLNLMFQLQRAANCYFLAIACLASISAISPLGSTTFWLPLFVVLGFTAAKDANEDYRRYKSDIEENSRVTEVYNKEKRAFEQVPWKDVVVGSIVRVTTMEDGCSPMIPSDLALIACSAEDGSCFLETANLDGETNLKLREAPEATHRAYTRPSTKEGSEVPELLEEELADFSCKIKCGHPDAFLYDFNARMEYKGDELPLNGGSSGGQLMQRSTKLRNSRWCVGVAVYTGKQTKIQMNMSDPPNKVSNIERKLNTYIYGLFATLFTLCVIVAIGAGTQMSTDTIKNAWYMVPESPTLTYDPGSAGSAGFFSFFSSLILLSLLIPISLYVSLEFVKLFIAVIISSDREMYAAEEDIPSKARSAGLCEELGQVNYIFSDKTGTLTQNKMEFKKCSIAGIEFGRGYCEVERAIARRNGKTLPDDPKPPPGLDEGFKFVDERLLHGKFKTHEHAEEIKNFFMNLALNHTVQVEYTENKPDFPLYQAESPDEGAFVVAARNMGFMFSRRNMKDIYLKVSDGQVGKGQEKKWTILNINAFDNNRKRTSIVVQTFDDAGNEELTLLVKGADTSIMPFVDHEACSFFEQTQAHIDKFGDQGLRTLVFAGRSLSREEYNLWSSKYNEAALLAEGREEALRALASTIEEHHKEYDKPSALFDTSTAYNNSLKLHGVTALEDKLQENVGDCIAQLAKAFIKIWVLTGDKVETAINIGYATALLASEMEPLLRLTADDLISPPDGWQSNASQTELTIDKAINAIRDKAVAQIVESANAGRTTPGMEELFGKLLTIGQKMQSQPRPDSAGGASMAADANELGTIENKLKESLLKERVRAKIKELKSKTAVANAGGYGLVIDGPCLRAAMQEDVKIGFLEVGLRCKAVVCCRVTPSQKAQVTLLVKDNLPGQITLAIGDGANDVSMIQAAHIGIGIRGKEGQQAVLASDYALPRFAYLERLLLIHGRWSYNRIGTMVCYFFYKNVAFAFTLFWFATENAFSAQALYDDGYQSLYNVIFTSLPVMVFAILDRDLEPEMVRAHPELYTVGQFNLRFTPLRFLVFVVGSIIHSLILYYVTIRSLDLNQTASHGRQTGLWGAGTTVLTNVIIVVTTTMGVHTRSWSWVHWFVYLGSVGIWYIFLLAYHGLEPGFFGDADDNIYNIIFELAGTAMFWLNSVLVALTCVLPILCYKYYKEQYYPQIDDYYRRVVAEPQNYPQEDVRMRDSNDSLRISINTPPSEMEVVGGYNSNSAKKQVEKAPSYRRNQTVTASAQSDSRCDFTAPPSHPTRGASARILNPGMSPSPSLAGSRTTSSAGPNVAPLSDAKQAEVKMQTQPRPADMDAVRPFDNSSFKEPPSNKDSGILEGPRH